jgi:hypothetical protein
MPFGAAKKCIGKLPARRQSAKQGDSVQNKATACKSGKFGGVPYPPEVTNLTPSLPLDRRGQGSQSTEFENCCVASMWYTVEILVQQGREHLRKLTECGSSPDH